MVTLSLTALKENAATLVPKRESASAGSHLPGEATLLKVPGLLQANTDPAFNRIKLKSTGIHGPVLFKQRLLMDNGVAIGVIGVDPCRISVIPGSIFRHRRAGPRLLAIPAGIIAEKASGSLLVAFEFFLQPGMTGLFKSFDKFIEIIGFFKKFKCVQLYCVR